MSQSTKGCSEKFGKKLIGRTDMDDALKRLDKLTQEEARMAVAQNLKATHAVDERVANMAVAIDDRVTSVDNRVAHVDDKVASIDDKMTSVDDKVTSVDDKVAGIDNTLKGIDARVVSVDDKVVVVDDKVAEVLHGAQIAFSQA
jgi:archaellum component FlaC